MNTFATLCASLGDFGSILRQDDKVLTIEISGSAIELAKITVGTVEWVAITVLIGEHVPARSQGLGSIIRCRGMSALRLTLPISEVSVATIEEVMQRLVGEAEVLRHYQPPVLETALNMHWAD